MEAPALPPRDSGRYSSAHPSDSEPPASLCRVPTGGMSTSWDRPAVPVANAADSRGAPDLVLSLSALHPGLASGNGRQKPSLGLLLGFCQ